MTMVPNKNSNDLVPRHERLTTNSAVLYAGRSYSQGYYRWSFYNRKDNEDLPWLARCANYGPLWWESINEFSEPRPWLSSSLEQWHWRVFRLFWWYFRKTVHREWVSWCFEPSQPQRIIMSGLKTNFSLSPYSYLFNKSLYHKFLFLKPQLKLYPQFWNANPGKQ